LSILGGFIEALSRILDEAYASSERTIPHPGVFFASSLALTFISALSNTPSMWFAAGLYSAMWAPVLKPRSRAFLAATGLTLLLGLVPALPILLLGVDQGKMPNASPTAVVSLVLFVSRVVLSPMPIIIAVTSFGWSTIAQGLSEWRLARRFVSRVNFFMLNTRFIASVFAYYLAGRESRVIVKSNSLSWRLLAVTLADVIAKFTEVSRDIVKAYESRCIRGC